MKYPFTKQQENAGLNYIRTIVNNCGAIFRSIGESDVGIDGYIEFVDSEEATGFIVGVQAKSGNSYINRQKQEYVIKSDLAHLKYWANSIIPIVGIVYDSESKVAGWVDLSKFSLDHLKQYQPNYTIHFPFASQFNENSFPKSFQKAFEPYRLNNKLMETLESISSPNTATRLLGVLALRQHRTNKIACFVFSNLLHDPDIEIRRTAIIWSSTYLPHPDIFWTDEIEIATGDLRKYALFLANGFNRCTIQSMLEAIDEEGMERGSIGQCVWVIILEIPSYKDHLNAIARDHTISDWLRFYSICTLEEIGLLKDRTLLEDLKNSTHDPVLLKIINEFIENFDNSANS